MKIIVTGGAGFIGSCLVWKLNTVGVTEIIIVDELGVSEKWKNLLGKRFTDYYDKTVFVAELERGMFDNWADSIVHLGACSSTTETNASYLMDNNYGFSKKMAEWALRRGKRLIYASSAATYGAGEHGYDDSDSMTPVLRPLNMYGYSKQAFDLWVLQHSLEAKITGLKFFNVFGPNEYHKDDMRSMVLKGYEQLIQHGVLRLFKSYRDDYADGEQKRDFIYVKDAVAIIWHFLEHPERCGIVNVGTGKAHSWNDLARALCNALGQKERIEYFEMPEPLRGKYQYFTEAKVAKLRDSGYGAPFWVFDEAVKEYVTILQTSRYL